MDVAARRQNLEIELALRNADPAVGAQDGFTLGSHRAGRDCDLQLTGQMNAGDFHSFSWQSIHDLVDHGKLILDP